MNDQTVKYTVEVNKTGHGGKEAAAELKEMQNASREVAQELIGFTSVAGAVLIAIEKVKEVVHESIAEYIAEEQAVAKLNATLRASGQYSAEYSKELGELGESLQAVTTHGHTAVLGVESQLVAFGAAREQIPQLTEAVLDLAEGMGRDLGGATMLVSKAVSGEFGTLRRYGIIINENSGYNEKLAQTLEQIRVKFGGLARAAADTASGGLAQTRNEIKDLEEAFGGFLLHAINPFVHAIHDAAVAIKELQAALPSLGNAPAFIAQGLGQILAPGAMAALRLLPGAAHAAAGALGGNLPDLEAPDPVKPHARRRLPSEDKALDDLIGLTIDRANASLDEYNKKVAEADREWAKVNDEIKKLGGQGDANEEMMVLAGAANDAARARAKDLIEQERTDAITKQLMERHAAEVEFTKASEDMINERTALQLTGLDAEIFKAEEAFEKRKQQIGDMKDLEEDEYFRLIELNDQLRDATVARLKESTTYSYQLNEALKQVGETAERSFASGLAGALVDIINHTKSAEQAFKQFAASFLSEILKMIIQAEILAAIKGVIGLLGDGGSVVSQAAKGGSFARYAAAGAIFASTGVAGVSEVNSATYFPRFNVVAGEAGREVMTVMARPREFSMGGVSGVMGDVGPNKVAMMNANQLGGLSGAGGGRIDINVAMSPGLVAQITRNSVEGAAVHVANQLATDSPISRGVKNLTA